jgi:hypothetical protein
VDEAPAFEDYGLHRPAVPPCQVGLSVGQHLAYLFLFLERLHDDE